MPEVLGNPPSPRTALFWNGTAWQWALVDAAGHLQTDVLSILGLEGALQSVGTDRLIVRGEDQLFSYRYSLLTERTAVISGAGGFVNSPTPAAGHVWVVTSVAAQDQTSATTAGIFVIARAAAAYHFHVDYVGVGATAWYTLQCEKHLEPGDVVQVYFIGGLAGDTCKVVVTGYQMTLEV